MTARGAPDRINTTLATEIDGQLRLLERADEHIWQIENQAPVRALPTDRARQEFWEDFREGVLGTLRVLDRIRIAAGLPPDPRVSQRLSQSTTRTAA